jgi:hypothetical protein
MAEAKEFPCGHFRFLPTRFKECPVCAHKKTRLRPGRLSPWNQKQHEEATKRLRAFEAKAAYEAAPPEKKKRFQEAGEEARRMLKDWGKK